MSVMIDGGFNSCECDVEEYMSKYNLTYADTSMTARHERSMRRYCPRRINVWFKDHHIYHLDFKDRDDLYWELICLNNHYSDKLELLGKLAIDLPTIKIRFTLWEWVKYSFLRRLKFN